MLYIYIGSKTRIKEKNVFKNSIINDINDKEKINHNMDMII